jgi:conjugal transfer pilus assembly protein TraU
MIRVKGILCILFFLIAPILHASDLCHGDFVNPITDVCWTCLFPITLGSVKVVNSHTPDTSNPSSPICACPGDPLPRIGISIGFWEPIALVDVTRSPFCLVNLGGVQLNLGHSYNKGYAETANPDQNSSFYYVHWYRFPLLYWLNLLIDGLCLEKGGFDIAYLTELDPTWRDDELSFLLNPEAALFGNPLTQAACSADSLASLTGLPIDSLFWCAGSQGSLYPLSGQVQEHVGGVQASTLLAERMAFKLHREGLLWDSTGQNGTALCYQTPTPIIPKSRYRYQMVNPLPTTGEGGCFPFGRTTSLWGSNHEYPYKGEDFGYLIWRKKNCCAF